MGFLLRERLLFDPLREPRLLRESAFSILEAMVHRYEFGIVPGSLSWLSNEVLCIWKVLQRNSEGCTRRRVHSQGTREQAHTLKYTQLHPITTAHVHTNAQAQTHLPIHPRARHLIPHTTHTYHTPHTPTPLGREGDREGAGEGWGRDGGRRDTCHARSHAKSDTMPPSLNAHSGIISCYFLCYFLVIFFYNL